MYLTLLCLGVALLVGVGTFLLGAGWFGGCFFGFLAFVAAWIVGVRLVRRRLDPLLVDVQKKAEANQMQAALAALRKLLPLSRWMPLLPRQVQAQIGFLLFHQGQLEEAEKSLRQAGPRSADAQLMLAMIHVGAGRKAEALEVLARAAARNRRHLLLHNTRAWLLHREGRRDEAIQALAQLGKHADAISRDNLLRLQNDQKMNMKSFGMAWYGLGLEKPPASMGELRTGRKGFRQPPRRRA